MFSCKQIEVKLYLSTAVDVDVSLDEMPSIFFMDCTLNDCSAILHSLNQVSSNKLLDIYIANDASTLSLLLKTKYVRKVIIFQAFLHVQNYNRSLHVNNLCRRDNGFPLA